MNAEVLRFAKPAAMALPLQWGRVRMNAEVPSASMNSAANCELQWGRVRMNAEVRRRGRDAREEGRFNGAAFG